jgi:hypothetical protein
MKPRANAAQNHRLPERPAYGSVLFLFACLMVVAARVLYFRSFNREMSEARCRSGSAHGIRISTSCELISDLDENRPSICTQLVSGTLRAREQLITLARQVPPSPALFNL